MRRNSIKAAARRTARHLHPMLIVVGLTVGLAACSSGDSSSSAELTYERLRDGVTATSNGDGADGPCAVDLDGAMASAGLVVDAPATGSVEAVSAEPAGTADLPTSSEPVVIPARSEAVFVKCTGVVGDATIHVQLYAGEDDAAALILLPELAHEADLPSASVQQIADRLGDSDIGAPIELPVAANDVAFARTKIAGATSAAFLLTSTGSIDAAVLDQVVEELDAVLH